MIVEVNGMGAQHPDVGMPGQLQGEIGVLDFEHNAADQPPVVEGVEADSSDDEMDIEVRRDQSPVSPLILVSFLHDSRSR